MTRAKVLKLLMENAVEFRKDKDGWHLKMNVVITDKKVIKTLRKLF